MLFVLCVAKSGSSETIADKDSMSNVNDEVKAVGDKSIKEQEVSPKVVEADIPMTFVETEQHDSLEHPKKNNDNEEKEDEPSKEDEMLTTMRLVGEPLATHGPYTFYSALAYRKRDDITKKKRRRWKKPMTGVGNESDNAAESYDSSSSCCCANNDAGSDLCFCDDGSSLSSSHSEWSVVHMNHFYAVRPWYSKRNSSSNDRQQLRQRRRQRKNSPKLSKTTNAVAERQQHHYQQSVCIGELELLWRDDSVLTSTTSSSSSSQLKKRNNNRIVPPTLLPEASNDGGDKTDTIITSSNIQSGAVASSDDDDVSGGFDDDSATLLPRRRTLPRRTRQPSAKKLEAAESYAAVAAAASSDNHLSSQSPYNRNRVSTAMPSDPTSVSVPLLSPDAQYNHGNILCSVRLYVMPDQTAAGRLGGVHGEDEVLEINTWNSSGGADRWPSNIFINGGSGVGSIYNGGGSVDDYGYGSGSHSSGTLPSGCSGLVLRAEDFVEWVRGGLINDDDENEDTESDDESSESECNDNSSNDQKSNRIETLKTIDEQQLSELSTLITDIKGDVKQCQKVILESTQAINVVTKEDLLSVNSVKAKEEQEDLLSVNPVKVKEEQEDLLSVNPVKVKEEQEDLLSVSPVKVKEEQENLITADGSNYYSKFTVEEAVEAEHVPLAAARIHKKHCEHTTNRHRHCHRQRHHLNHESLVNGDSTSSVAKKDDHPNFNVSTGVNKGTIHAIPNLMLFFVIFTNIFLLFLQLKRSRTTMIKNAVAIVVNVVAKVTNVMVKE